MPAGRPKLRSGQYERITVEVAHDVLAFIDAQPVSRRKFIESLVRKEMRERKELMKYNSEKDAYFGVTSDARAIRVEGVEYLESQQDGADEELLGDPDMWATLIGANQNVEYVDANEKM